MRQTIAKRRIAAPERTPSAPTETATASAWEARTGGDQGRGAGADLCGRAGGADRQRCGCRTGAEEEEREREREADPERAQQQEDRDRTDEPAGRDERPRF